MKYMYVKIASQLTLVWHHRDITFDFVQIHTCHNFKVHVLPNSFVYRIVVHIISYTAT